MRMIIGWCIAVICFIFCTWGFETLIEKDYEYDVVWEAIFGSISRPIWAIGLSWIIFASINGYGGERIITNFYIKYLIFSEYYTFSIIIIFLCYFRNCGKNSIPANLPSTKQNFVLPLFGPYVNANRHNEYCENFPLLFRFSIS